MRNLSIVQYSWLHGEGVGTPVGFERSALFAGLLTLGRVYASSPLGAFPLVSGSSFGSVSVVSA